MNLMKYIAQVSLNEENLNIPKTDLTENSAQTLIQIFFGIAAATAVLVIAISAFKMTISRGNAENVKKARDAIVYASVGLAISLSGFAIVTFFVESI